jgi:hypothetical protein
MKTKVFKKDYLVKELGLPDDYDQDKVTVHINEICDSGRWTISYRLVFSIDGIYYQTYYSEGATEMQDESAWEFEDEVECTIVEPKKVTVVEYLPVE